MRLIDADALKKLRHDYIQGRIKFDGSEYDLIDKCPTIEAEPVKHGQWIFDVCNHREHMKCSECLHSYEPTGVFTYCPNCGAKMQGGKYE